MPLLRLQPRRCGKTTAHVLALKGQAYDALVRFDELLERVDCGAHMLKTINPEAQACADRFNAAMAAIQRLDPTCPKWVPL
jgi:hypothetical protein